MEALTDLGNARRFVTRYGDQVAYFNNGPSYNRGWSVRYDGDRWKPINKTKAIQMMVETVLSIQDEAKALAAEGNEVDAKLTFKWATRSQSHARIMAALRLAQSDRKISFD